MKTKFITSVLLVIVFVYANCVFAGTEGTSITLYGANAGQTIITTIPPAVMETLKNTFIGAEAGMATTYSNNNTFVGNSAGKNSTDFASHNNTLIGFSAGINNIWGENNTFLGANTGLNNQTGSGNVFIGYNAGGLEEGDEKLYIDNSNISTPLIYGDFYDDIVTVHGSLGVGITPSSPLTVAGIIESTSGGIKFPDGTTMSSAGGVSGGFSADGTINTSTEYQINNTTLLKAENNNTYIGRDAGSTNGGLGNVFLGYQAGFNEAGSNKLYISNSNTDNPLVYGEFDNDLVIIYGSLEIQGAAQSSDKRFKKNFNSVENALDKVIRMNGVSYEWKREEFENRGFPNGRHYGLIGQEVEKVLPDVVSEGRDGYKKVAYTEIIPVLIEAVKEQQKTISTLSDKVKKLERKLELRGSVAMIDSQ